MLGTSQRKKQGPVKSCLIPIAGFIGFIAGCYLLCAGLFLLNGGRLSFAAPPAPTAIPTEIPPAPAETETPTPSSFFQRPPAVVGYHLQVQIASYPLTLANYRS